MGDIEATAEITYGNLKIYMHLLCDCGYLEVVGRRNSDSHLPFSRRTRFTLVNDTGPRNPRQVKGGTGQRLRDANTGEEIYAKEKRSWRESWVNG